MSGGIRQCAHGHLSLDSANWVCPWCEIARLEEVILAATGPWSAGLDEMGKLLAEARRIRAQREEGKPK